VLERLLDDDAAVGARGHYRVNAEFLYLRFLALEGNGAQRFGALVGRDPATAAAAPVHDAGIAHLAEQRRNLLEQRARLFIDAATTRDLAGIVVGDWLVYVALQLEAPGPVQVVEHFENVLDLETEGAPHQVRPFPADRRIGMAALGLMTHLTFKSSAALTMRPTSSRARSDTPIWMPLLVAS